MRDEQDRETQPVPERHQLLDYLPLGDDVECSGRLVHDQDLGVKRDRHRDHDALPHPARQLVRVAAQAVSGDADLLEQFPGPGPPGGPVKIGAVCLEDVGELGADRHHRVECVHGALHHHGQMVPAQTAELGGTGHEEVTGRARIQM